MIEAVDSALENREAAFDCVPADYDILFLSRIDFPRVANHAVTPDMPSQSTVDYKTRATRHMRTEVLARVGPCCA